MSRYFCDLVDRNFYIDEKPVGIIKDIMYNYQNKYIITYTNLSTNFNETVTVNEDELKVLEDELAIRKERFDFIQGREINALVHFTKIENIDSILNYGLLSREYMDKHLLEYKYSDPCRLDNMPNYISTSITFPNYKMFYSKRLEDPEQKWILVRINPIVMVHKLSTQFFETNAASNYSVYQNIDHTSNYALERLFDDSRDDIPSNYTNDPQAEVLIRKSIDLGYINGFSFDRFPGDRIKQLLIEKQIPRTYHSFSGRSDYERWR